MRRPTLPLLVLGCAAALIASMLVTATSASAETKRGTDPRGDVQRIDRDGNLVRTGLANGDIVGYRVSYNRQRFELVLRYRALNFRRDGHTAAALLQWGAGGDRDAAFGVLTRPKDRAGTTESEGLRRNCRIRHRISYRDNRIMMRVPSRCFGAPPAVRLQILTGSYGDLRSFESLAVDIAPGDGLFSTRMLRVRRG